MMIAPMLFAAASKLGPAGSLILIVVGAVLVFCDPQVYKRFRSRPRDDTSHADPAGGSEFGSRRSRRVGPAYWIPLVSLFALLLAFGVVTVIYLPRQ